MALLRVSNMVLLNYRCGTAFTKNRGDAPDVCVLPALNGYTVACLQVTFFSDEAGRTAIEVPQPIAVTEPIAFQCCGYKATECCPADTSRNLPAG